MRRFNALSIVDPVTWNRWSEHGVYQWLKDALEKNNQTMNLIVDNTVLYEEHDKEDSYGILIESPDILEWYHKDVLGFGGASFFETLTDKMKRGDHRFRKLYTFDKRYQGIPNTVIMGQTCFPTIPKERMGLYREEKKELVTFITSNKNMTKLQEFRMSLARNLIDKGIPVFGRGYNPVECKSEVLRKSMFCFAVENGIYRGYHTEKVMDCFVTGCVPIYIGDPDISDHYDTRGMIIFKNPEEMMEKGVDISADLYYKMLPFVERNYEIATKEYTPSFEKCVSLIYEDMISHGQ